MDACSARREISGELRHTFELLQMVEEHDAFRAALCRAFIPGMMKLRNSQIWRTYLHASLTCREDRDRWYTRLGTIHFISS